MPAPRIFVLGCSLNDASPLVWYVPAPMWTAVLGLSEAKIASNFACVEAFSGSAAAPVPFFRSARADK
jgi:hypothetical protein